MEVADNEFIETKGYFDFLKWLDDNQLDPYGEPSMSLGDECQVVIISKDETSVDSMLKELLKEKHATKTKTEEPGSYTSKGYFKGFTVEAFLEVKKRKSAQIRDVWMQH